MTQILVVEDEQHILDNVVETLEMEGFTVHGANNGRSGIDTARNIKPDLILCDIMMPDVSGYEVLMTLRSEPELMTTPFVFLTALANRASMREGMELGADDYLTKPFTPHELLAAVNTRLDKKDTLDQKHQEEMSSLREQIIYALPHEFRTPLSGLIGCADFLRMVADTIDPDSIRNLGDVILRSSQRLQNLTENYLLYAQIELFSQDPSSLQKMQQERLDYPITVLTEAAEANAELMEREEDLQLDIDNGIVPMSYDNFKKITNELINNAFKFSKPGNPVQISAGWVNGTYEITIADHGRGMSEDEVQRIGAYVQFNRALYEQQGLGLGLIISKRLVEIHNGEFEVKSKPDVGTVITLRFNVDANT